MGWLLILILNPWEYFQSPSLTKHEYYQGSKWRSLLPKKCLSSSIFITIYTIFNLCYAISKPHESTSKAHIPLKMSIYIGKIKIFASKISLYPTFLELIIFFSTSWMTSNPWEYYWSPSSTQWEYFVIPFSTEQKDLQIKNHATKNQPNILYFWNNIASLQPPEGLQKLIYNPMSVLSKTIFNKIWVLSKVTLSSLLKNQLRADLFGTK